MSKQSWRKRSMSAADIPDYLPINNPASAVGRKESSRLAMKYKLIHLIPLIVIFCVFILWCFSSPEMETKDVVTAFVPIINKPQPEGEEKDDVDITVLALESPPDDFWTISDAPYPPLALHEQPNVSLLETFDQNASLTDSYVTNVSLVSYVLKAPSAVSHEPSASFSDSHDHGELLSDSHEPKASFSVSHDVNFLFPDSNEPIIVYPSTSNEASPHPIGES